MKYLNGFVNELRNIIGARLLAVYVFGAKANSASADRHQNTDLLIIVEDHKVDDLINFLPVVKKWIELGNPSPIILPKVEFFANTNIFAIEYSDMKWNNQLVYGDDLLRNIDVDYYDLRSQCEKELKRAIQRVREFYLENGPSPKETMAFANAAIRSIIVIFRAILRVNGVTPSVYKHDVVDQLAKFVELDKIFFKKMIENKEKNYKYTPNEITDLCNYLQTQLSIILKQFNEHQF